MFQLTKHFFTKRKRWLNNLESYADFVLEISAFLRKLLLLYKCTFKPIWTYGVQVWGITANSNIEILQQFRSKILRMIV